MVEKLRNGRDFIGFLGHAELSQDQPGIGRIGAQGMERFEAPALVVDARPYGFEPGGAHHAYCGGHHPRRWPWRCGMAAKVEERQDYRGRCPAGSATSG